MKMGKDISAQFKELYIVHQNIPGKKASTVTYNQHILFIPLQGEITIEIVDQKYSISPGQMFYLSPGITHSFLSSAQSGERLIAMLKPSNKNTNDISLNNLKLPLNHLIKEILFYLLLHPETKNEKSLVNIFSETLQEVLISNPFRGVLDHQEGKVIDPKVKHVLKLINNSIQNPQSIGDIAKSAGLSLRSLNRLVLKETGIQPRQWLINARIDLALELLKKPGVTVTEVAMEVGYNSLGQFIAAFRSRTGQLPSEYLKLGRKPKINGQST